MWLILVGVAFWAVAALFIAVLFGKSAVLGARGDDDPTTDMPEPNHPPTKNIIFLRPSDRVISIAPKRAKKRA